MTALADTAARTAAIDPRNSYCVSAPAGSGKTELLIQRYLALLSHVRRPEQVLAITFTRKAAAEMRERVTQALRDAQAKLPCGSAHAQVTRAQAEAALAMDERENWGLLHTASRFNIRTIDSFCASLARQMPVLSQIGGQADAEDDVTALYAEAVVGLYALLEEAHPVAADLAALLLHFDNDWDRLGQLLVAMLARREQWRGYLGIHREPAESEAYLIATVEALVIDRLRETAALLSPFTPQLLALLQYAAANLATSVPQRLPGSAPQDLPEWYPLLNLLLTKTGDWRKSPGSREGFPAGRGEERQRKAQWRELLPQLQGVDGLRERLASIRCLPAVESGSLSWKVALHLSRLLPVLAAQLLLVFRRHEVVDHSQVAASALLALGDDDAPTELSLRLDYRIEHILVDEFQDTAITQFELLHKLTRGWGEHNALHPASPRTLLIVGDGMQSIYGFRGANVGLFLRARREGFNGVVPRYLELRCNFRSDAGVVNWVNRTFQRAFPARDDASRSQIGFREASPVRPLANTDAVATHAFTGATAREQEVGFVCDAIADTLAHGGGTVAVLGRNRSHLQPIIRRLKQMHIPYSAPELDSLAESPVVTDLVTLCRALVNEFDRLAWFALLRAPWCGLRLADLLTVAEAARHGSVWASLGNAAAHEQISTDGRNRLLRILPVLQRAMNTRDRLDLRVWIEQTWRGLGGPMCCPNAEHLHDAESFLQLLEATDMAGAALDLNWLESQVRRRFMASGDPKSQVQLMTLHKSKGLEFDCVIIPQLDRVPRQDAREILLWDEHTNSDGERAFLLAADDHSPPHEPTLYNFLQVQRSRKSLLENTRLLYVGATRAISRLVLCATVSLDTRSREYREPAARSLLHCIWPDFAAQMQVHDSADDLTRQTGRREFPGLVRLRRMAPELPVAVAPDTGLASTAAPVAAHDNHTERVIGTVVHLALQELAERASLPDALCESDLHRWRAGLRQNGVWGPTLEPALVQVVDSVSLALRAGGRGRWILASTHAEARSEWALTIVDAGGAIRDIIIDRSFIDRASGERWVIDYKTSRPIPGESVAEFAARQSATYLDQLRTYRDAVRALENAPVRCALYFTALGLLHAIPALDFPPCKTGLTP